jgi:rRNA processing protein Krr1/Pno1
MLQVQTHLVNRLVGTKGARINLIRTQSGAKVKIAPDTTNPKLSKVTIVGSAAEVQTAEEMILSTIKPAKPAVAAGKHSSERPAKPAKSRSRSKLAPGMLQMCKWELDE